MNRIGVGDVELHVVERGSGPALLMVHGFPLDHSMWQKQLEGLSEVCRVIAPDLRGFGQSTSGTSGTVTMERYADDLAGLLDALGVREPVVFCGLSMGGYVAWQFWRKYPSRVRALILCDTRASADTAAAARERLSSAQNVLENGLGKLAEFMAGKLFSDATRRDQPNLVEGIREQILKASPQAVAAALRGMAERPDVRDELPTVHVPALVICGEDDGITPPDEMRRMAASMPQASYVEVPHAGHLAPLENPTIVNSAILQFLAKIAV